MLCGFVGLSALQINIPQYILSCLQIIFNLIFGKLLYSDNFTRSKIIECVPLLKIGPQDLYFSIKFFFTSCIMFAFYFCQKDFFKVFRGLHLLCVYCHAILMFAEYIYTGTCSDRIVYN